MTSAEKCGERSGGVVRGYGKRRRARELSIGVVPWGPPWRGAKLLDSGSCRPYPSCAMWGARRLTTTKSRIELPVESIRNGQARTAEYSEMDQEIY